MKQIRTIDVLVLVAFGNKQMSFNKEKHASIADCGSVHGPNGSVNYGPGHMGHGSSFDP